MKKLLNWFKEVFDKDSSTSSKRFVGVMMAVWAMVISSYYIYKIQHGGTESVTTVTILEFATVSAVGLLAGGTAAEALKSKSKKDDEK